MQFAEKVNGAEMGRALPVSFPRHPSETFLTLPQVAEEWPNLPDDERRALIREAARYVHTLWQVRYDLRGCQCSLFALKRVESTQPSRWAWIYPVQFLPVRWCRLPPPQFMVCLNRWRPEVEAWTSGPERTRFLEHVLELEQVDGPTRRYYHKRVSA